MGYDIVDFKEVTNEIWATYRLEDGTKHCERVVAIGHLEFHEGSGDQSFRELVFLRHKDVGHLGPVNETADNETFTGITVGQKPDYAN